jgi:hypothetical protein
LAGFTIQPPLKPSPSASIASQRTTPTFARWSAAAGIVGEEFEPDFGLAHHRRFVDPQPVGAELEADRRGFGGEWLQADDVAVEGYRRLVLVRRHFHGDVDAAPDLRGHSFSPAYLSSLEVGSSPRISLG